MIPHFSIPYKRHALHKYNSLYLAGWLAWTIHTCDGWFWLANLFYGQEVFTQYLALKHAIQATSTLITFIRTSLLTTWSWQQPTSNCYQYNLLIPPCVSRFHWTFNWYYHLFSCETVYYSHDLVEDSMPKPAVVSFSSVTFGDHSARVPWQRSHQCSWNKNISDFLRD